jgi:hypothetical protein
MSSILMLFAEVLVAILLVATVVTSVRLSRRITRMQADEAAMRATVIELMKATETAERAIAGLRSTLGECEKTLGDRLRVAERYASDLAEQVEAGESVMNRMMSIVESSQLVTSERARAEPQPARIEPSVPVPQSVFRAAEPPAPVAAPQPVAFVAAAPSAPSTPATAQPQPAPRRMSDRISDAAELLAQRAMRRAAPEGNAA